MNFISPDDFFQLPPDKQRDYLHRVQNIKYGLYWNERRHAENVVTQCETLMPVLDEAEDKRIFYTPPAANLFDTPERPQPTHLLIEGDNYHALSVLNYTHRGKVDLIYIDPPYNTGNRDFRYNDNFVDKEDGDRHTKWLSFMQRRLLLAKDLLKESGVIFISIDDNEVAQLKLLCDKVFGEGRFLATFVWKSRQNKDNRNKTGVSIDHEYLICFGNKLKGSERNVEQYRNPDNDPRGPWTSSNMVGLATKDKRPNLHFDLINPDTGINYGCPKMGWRFEPKTMERLRQENKIIWPNNLDGRPRRKFFFSELEDEFTGYSTLIGENVFTNTGSKELAEMFENRGFAFPKPSRLIKEIVSQVENETPIILDFFAGSGTTGHAVLELNKEDGGRRQFILVTNNEVTDKTRHQLRAEGKTTEEIEEQGICRAVTYPRLQKVIEGYTNPKGEKVSGTGGKLRYFRTGFTPDAAEPGGATALAVSPASANPDQAAYNLRDKCAEMICVRENVFDRQAKTEAWELYRDFNRLLALLYDDAPENVTALRDRMAAEPATERILYVFTLGMEISPDLAASFEGVRLESIPARIIDLYKRHLQQTARKTRLQQIKTAVAEPDEDILPDNKNNTPAT